MSNAIQAVSKACQAFEAKDSVPHSSGIWTYSEAWVLMSKWKYTDKTVYVFWYLWQLSH